MRKMVCFLVLLGSVSFAAGNAAELKRNASASVSLREPATLTAPKGPRGWYWHGLVLKHDSVWNLRDDVYALRFEARNTGKTLFNGTATLFLAEGQGRRDRLERSSASFRISPSGEWQTIDQLRVNGDQYLYDDEDQSSLNVVLEVVNDDVDEGGSWYRVSAYASKEAYENGTGSALDTSGAFRLDYYDQLQNGDFENTNLDELTDAGCLAVDHVVGEHDGKRLVTDKCLGVFDGIPKAFGFLLTNKADIGHVRNFPNQTNLLVLSAFMKSCLQLVVDIKIILNGLFRRRHDDEDILDSCLDCLLDDIVDVGRINDRQHFLRKGLRCRKKTRPHARCGNDGFCDLFHRRSSKWIWGNYTTFRHSFSSSQAISARKTKI